MTQRRHGLPRAGGGDKRTVPRKAMVSGCFDRFHSGHLEFLTQASAYGELHVVIGTDANVKLLKNVHPTNDQNERKFIVENVKPVHAATIASGSGLLDFEQDMIELEPDVFVVNEDGDTTAKRRLCESLGVEYVVLKRAPRAGLPARSSTALRRVGSRSEVRHDTLRNGAPPQRICLAGGWIDQPFVNAYSPGSVTVAQIESREDRYERAGLASSSRKVWLDLIDKGLSDDVDPAELAMMLFYLENGRELMFGYRDPERRERYVSGSQDHIGLTHAGISRLDYENGSNKGYWPVHVESTTDRRASDWLERHLVLIPIGERPHGYDPLAERNFSTESIAKLGRAGADCYDAILNRDLTAFGRSLTDTHDAWREILPLTTNPEIDAILDSYNELGAGRTTSGCGGGYAIIATDRDVADFPNAFRVKVRTT